MNPKLLVIALIFLSNVLLSQTKLQLTAQMPDCKNENFLLLKGDEGGVYVIDQAMVSVDGSLFFTWEGDYGFYRLQGDLGKIDFLIKTEDFKFSLIGKPGDGELSFPDKDENNQFHYYLSEFNILDESIQILGEDIKKMDQNDTLFKQLNAQYRRLRKDKKSLLKDLWNKHLDAWPVRMALAQQELMPDVKVKEDQYNEYYQKHFFDYFTFTDTVLQATPIYYEKIGRYLKANDIDELLNTRNYKKLDELIRSLFWKTELAPNSQEYLANYLMNRYPKIQYPQMFQLTVDAYKVLHTCEYVLSGKTIKKRLEDSRKFAKDSTVPDLDLFYLEDRKIQSISDVNSELTLIVVWSGNCEQSRQLLNRIKNLYPEYKQLGLEVVAISLDYKVSYWRQFVIQDQYPWINACDTGGLNGLTANQLSVSHTPVMLLCDSSLKMVAKPQTYFQLEQELMEYFK